MRFFICRNELYLPLPLLIPVLLCGKFVSVSCCQIIDEIDNRSLRKGERRVKISSVAKIGGTWIRKRLCKVNKNIRILFCVFDYLGGFVQ